MTDVSPPADAWARDLLGGGALLLAWITGLWFYGAGVNLVVLVVSVLFLLVGWVAVGGRALDGLGREPLVALLVVGIPLALLISYQLSVSPESSLAPSWVLATLPLAFVIGRGLTPVALRRCSVSMLVVAVGFAGVSGFRFLVFGERPQLPLGDPNNYSTLLYLAWIPFVHGWLTRAWRGDAVPPAASVGCALISMALILPVFASRSRVGALVVVGALALWLVVALVRRLPKTDTVLVIVSATLAYGAVRLAGSLGVVDAGAEQLGEGVAIRAALAGSAWSMFLDYPLTGTGVFGFGLLYPAYRSLLDQDTAGLFVHNDYIQLLAEGGILLVPLILVLVAAVFRSAVRFVVLPPDRDEFARLGFAMAIGVACLHATVNFVFYSLPLMIMLGVLAALLYPRRPRVAAPEPAGSGDPLPPSISVGAPWLVAGGLVIGSLGWLFLVLDLAIVGVFLGQRNVPWADSVRQDETRMLNFSRQVQRLSSARSAPVLAEAMILQRWLASDPTLSDAALGAHRRAIGAGPFNPVTYRAMAQHLAGTPHPRDALGADETIERMLLRSVSIDPTFAPGIDGLLAYYRQIGAEEQRFVLLRQVVLPWMPLLKRHVPEAATRYLDELGGYAEVLADEKLVAELADLREDLDQVNPVQRRYWLFDPTG